MEKKILYIDMDGVIANFEKAIKILDPTLEVGDGNDYEVRSKKVHDICLNNCDIFHNLEPIEGAIEAVNELFDYYDVLFLSTPMWVLPESYIGKRIWLGNHFGDKAIDRLILTKRKDLNHGDYLIDDTLRNGVLDFKGHHIHFGTEEFPNWEKVLQYLKLLLVVDKSKDTNELIYKKH